MKIKIGNICHMIVHYVGNKSREEGVSFSEKELDFTDVSADITSMLDKSFDAKEPCHFYFESSLALNPIYTFVKTIFGDVSRFQEQSEFIAKILYEKTSHPMTKSGELNIIYLSDCEIDGKKTDAIAMLKTENKQPAYQYLHTEHGYEIQKSEVISFAKVEKGCLILNINENNGYVVFSVDKKSKGIQSKYWKDDFLHIMTDITSYSQTKNLLNSCKTFIADNYAEDSKVEKANLISKVRKVLEQTETLSIHEFSQEIFSEDNLDKQFEKYLSSKDNPCRMHEEDILIEKPLVKRKSSLPKTTLYLDSNFEINILGGHDYIVQGYDEAAGMNYYQFFYNKEK